jgi:hypothetical protein
MIKGDINNEGGIDEFRIYWDTKEVVDAMMSSAKNRDIQVPPKLDNATTEKNK